MKYKKAIIIVSGLFIIAGLGATVALMQADTPEETTIAASNIPFDIKETPTPEPQASTENSTIIEQAPATSSSNSTAVEDTLPTSIPADPKTYFSASSDQYPGSGSFVLPNFQTDADWSVTFSYTCDTGNVFVVAYPNPAGVMLTSSPSATFGTRSGHLKVVVPPTQNCTWSVSVS